MKVSLVICSYGRPEQLKGCLNSLDTEGLAKSDSELILVYTLGDDATAGVMKDYAAMAAGFPVKIVGTEKRGLSVARNAGIAKAESQLFIFTDDDCIMTPGYITGAVAGMESGPYAYGGGSIHNPYHHPPGVGHIRQKIILAPHSLIPAGVVQGGNMFFRKEVFDRLGVFREDMGASSGSAFVGAEDLEMASRASLAGFTGILLPEALNTHAHSRAPGSTEEKEVGRGYDLGRGAHYAYLMTHGIHESWNFWSGTAAPDQNRHMARATLERLQHEFEGASEYIKHCLKNNVDLPPA